MRDRLISIIKAFGWSCLQAITYISPYFIGGLALVPAGKQWHPTTYLVILGVVLFCSYMAANLRWQPYRPPITKPNPASLKWAILITAAITAMWFGLMRFNPHLLWHNLPLLWLACLMGYLSWSKHPELAVRQRELLRALEAGDYQPNPELTEIKQELAELTKEELEQIAVKVGYYTAYRAEQTDRHQLEFILSHAGPPSYRAAYLDVTGRPSILEEHNLQVK